MAAFELPENDSEWICLWKLWREREQKLHIVKTIAKQKKNRFDPIDSILNGIIWMGNDLSDCLGQTDLESILSSLIYKQYLFIYSFDLETFDRIQRRRNLKHS